MTYYLMGKNGAEIKRGDKVITFRGEQVTLTDYRAERNRVYCADKQGNSNEWYPSVINAEFVEQ